VTLRRWISGAWRYEGTCRYLLQGLQGPWNFCLETLQLKAIRSFEMSGGLIKQHQRYIQKTGFFNLTLHAFVESWLTINAAYSLRLRMSYSSLVYTPPFNLMTFMFHLNLRISSYITAAYI